MGNGGKMGEREYKRSPEERAQIKASMKAYRAKIRATPGLLRDMRWVYGKQEIEDRTEGQRRCREWLKEDRKGFLGQLAAMEKAVLARAPKPGEKAAAVVKDEGSERVRELIGRLLEECKGDGDGEGKVRDV